VWKSKEILRVDIFRTLLAIFHVLKCPKNKYIS
jgi:hypothetical protein